MEAVTELGRWWIVLLKVRRCSEEGLENGAGQERPVDVGAEVRWSVEAELELEASTAVA